MKKLIFTLAAGLVTIHAMAQVAVLEDAWRKFNQNKRGEARVLFEKAAKDPATAEDAQLVLSLLASVDKTPDVAFKHFMEFYKLSSDKYHYLNTLWFTESVNNGSAGKRSAQQLNFLKSLLKDPNLPGDLAARVHGMLGEHFQAIHDFKNSKKEFALMGSVEGWQLAGEFDNISASGYDKTWEPLQHAGPYTFTNKFGAPVNWFPVKNIRADKWVDLEQYFYASNSIIFAQNFVEAPADMEVQIRIGVSGSIKFWLNDQLMLAEEEERNNDLDNYIIKTRLKKGFNRLLLQMGESEADRCNFMLRITNEKGYPLPGLNYSSSVQPYPKDGKEPFSVHKPDALVFFENQVKSAPNNLLAHLMLAQCYLNADKKYESRKTLDRAEQLAPTSSYVKMKLVNVYTREENRTAIAKMADWLKTNDPKNPLSIYLQFSEAIGKEDMEQADSILWVMKQELPSKEDYLSKEIELLDKKKSSEKLIEAIENAYKLYPENGQFVGYKILLETQFHNNSEKAIGVLKKYYEKNFSLSNMKELAELYFSAGKTADGIKLLEKARTHFPGNMGLNYEMSNLSMQMRDYVKAVEYMELVLAEAPYISSYMSHMAKCYEEWGKYEEAKAFYTRAVLFNPNAYEERKKVRQLNGQREDIFTLFNQRDVYKLFKEAPAASTYPDDNSVVLLYERQCVAYNGGGAEERVTLVAKVFNASGIDVWKEYNLPVYAEGIIEKAEVIKANGTKLDAERSGGHVVFTNLEAGDGIHVSYRTQAYSSGSLMKHFTDRHMFEDVFPILISSYSLLVDRNVAFKWKFANDKNIEPTKTAKDNFNLYQWELTNVEPVRPEWSASRYVDYGQVVFVSTIPDWKWVSNWYSDLARAKQKPDFELKETVAALFAGKENLPVETRVRMIHHFIVTNIRYSSVAFRQSGIVPQKAGKTLITKVGDCKDVSTLFVAMCTEAGIPNARLVLIDTRDNGRNDLFLPSIDFNHCIAAITFDGKEHFIELTSDKNGFATFNPTLKNSLALRIYGEDENAEPDLFYLDAPTRMPDNIIRTSSVTFGQNKDLIKAVQTTHTGHVAAYSRYLYSDKSEAEKKKELLSALTRDNPGVKLNSLSFKKLGIISDSLELDYNYTITNAVSQITGLNIFAIPWSDKITTMGDFSEDKRKYPLNLWHLHNTDKLAESMIITLPTGKVLAEIPKNISFSCFAADYKVTYKVSAGKIEATREFTVKSDVIQPAQYEEFRKFYEKVIAEDTRQLAFK